jgi:hypothetical protein
MKLIREVKSEWNQGGSGQEMYADRGTFDCRDMVYIEDINEAMRARNDKLSSLKFPLSVHVGFSMPITGSMSSDS